jgi:hypothetical protein
MRHRLQAEDWRGGAFIGRPPWLGRMTSFCPTDDSSVIGERGSQSVGRRNQCCERFLFTSRARSRKWLEYLERYGLNR